MQQGLPPAKTYKWERYNGASGQAKFLSPSVTLPMDPVTAGHNVGQQHGALRHRPDTDPQPVPASREPTARYRAVVDRNTWEPEAENHQGGAKQAVTAVMRHEDLVT